MSFKETGVRLGKFKKKPVFYWHHLAALLGGILCALVPFIGEWELGPMQVPVRFGSGNFGFNILIGTSLCILGGVVGGYWWRLCKWWVGNRDGMLQLASVLLALLGVIGVFFDFLHPSFFYWVVGLLVLSGGYCFWKRERQSRRLMRGGIGWFNFIHWLEEKKRWNVVFFVILFLLLLLNNVSLLLGLDISLGAKIQAFIGRFMTEIVVVGGVFLLSELTMRASPRHFRWLPWLAFSLFPLLVLADQLIAKMWSRPLINVVNSMTQDGSFKPEVELATSGLDVGPVGARLIILGVWLFAGALAVGAWLISKHFRAKISMKAVLGIMAVAWFGVIVEQGVSVIWQSVANRQLIHKTFNVNIGLFAPPEGLAKYKVEFYTGIPHFPGKIPALDKKPDVFIFMMESTRADAIRPDVAPFLSSLRENECQELGKTWSGSNATHLSWFSFFHSRIPVFWLKALKSISNPEKFAGSEPLQRIKQAGYSIEVRAVCDLSYKNFGLSNFGSGKNLVDVMIQANDDSAFSKANIPERERLNFESLKQSVKHHHKGGGFYYTALDSTHYNYYWHKDFKPPFTEYDENTRFPLNPSKAEVTRVKNRYWNAVAWVDSEIADFCEFLKREGRYDESIIIVTGDHGEEFQERGSWFHCSSIQPEQTNVPILIKWPKSMGRGPAHKTASHLDVMPSVMIALGLPKEAIAGLAGVNLLEASEPKTAITTTAYAGQSGETMAMRRNGYEAVFSWPKYWDAGVPPEITLERLSAPGGKPIFKENAESYRKELYKIFPDAFQRFFKSFKTVE